MTVPEAVLALLRTFVTPVYDGQVPLNDKGRPEADRYAVLYADAGTRNADDLPLTADRFVHRWQVTSVGSDRRQAEWVAVKCRDALLDEPLAVDGWHTTPITHESSSVIRRDDDLPGPPVFYAVDTYSLTATR